MLRELQRSEGLPQTAWVAAQDFTDSSLPTLHELDESTPARPLPAGDPSESPSPPVRPGPADAPIWSPRRIGGAAVAALALAVLISGYSACYA